MGNQYISNPYVRVLTIISLLQEMNTGATVNTLADVLEVPKFVILDDLKNLKNSEDMDVRISLALQWDDEELDQIEVEAEKEEQFFKDLFDGKLNDKEILLSVAGIMPEDGKVTVLMSAFESELLNNFLNTYQYKNIPAKDEIKIKKKYNNITKKVMNSLKKLENAIANGNTVQITYLSKEHIMHNLKVLPLKIAKNISQELFYLVALQQSKDNFDGKIVYYRVDRILQLDIQPEKSVVDSDLITNTLEEFDYRWGMGAYEEPFDFRLQVFDEVNLPNRLKQELQYRKYGSWSKNADGSYLYQDKVSGYDALKNWVLSMGSSVKVLEPKKLAADIKNSAAERMKLYENR